MAPGYRQRPADKVLGRLRGSRFPPGGAVAPHRPAVTFPGTGAESRHLCPRAVPPWAAPVRYLGNRGGAPSWWGATVTPRHFQTALVPEPLAAAGRASADGGSRGRCASRRSGGEARPERPRGVARGRGASGAVPTPTPTPGGGTEGGPGAAGRKWGRAARGPSHRPSVRTSVRPGPDPGELQFHLPG